MPTAFDCCGCGAGADRHGGSGRCCCCFKCTCGNSNDEVYRRNAAATGHAAPAAGQKKRMGCFGRSKPSKVYAPTQPTNNGGMGGTATPMTTNNAGGAQGYPGAPPPSGAAYR